ncbi:MAG: hypothetical protein AAF416_13750 [Pseudomonadota bacterium]
MKRSKFSEEQVFAILREQGELCRAMGLRDMAMWLTAPEDENAKLKRLYADAVLGNAGLRDLRRARRQSTRDLSLTPDTWGARGRPDEQDPRDGR